jgi:hypothetical protein
MDNSIDLFGCEGALMAIVAHLHQFLFQWFTLVYPCTQSSPGRTAVKIRIVKKGQLCAPTLFVIAHFCYPFMILFLHYKDNKNCCIHKEECRFFHKTALFSMAFLHFENAVEAALK